MGKRIIATLLSLSLALWMVPTAALAAGPVPSGDPSVVKEGYVPSGVEKRPDGTYAPINSAIQYQITKEADGNHTLTFWSDTNAAAVFPTFQTEQQVIVSDGTVVSVSGSTSYTPANNVPEADKASYPNGYVTATDDKKYGLDAGYIPYLYCTGNVYHYSKLPWYSDKDNITKVVFDDSIAKVGQFAATHMPNLAEVVVENSTCKLVGNAIYFLADQQKSQMLTVTLASTCSMGTSAIANASRVQYRYSDVLEYELAYDDVFNGANVNNARAQEAWNAYENLSAGAKAQLGTDTVGDSGVTYYAKLQELISQGLIDSRKVIKDGLCPGSDTVRYELSTTDGSQTYQLRFYAPDGNGVMTDLVVDDANKTTNEMHYTNAGWYSYGSRITHVVYDTSIAKTGYLSAAHFYNCTLFEFLNPGVEVAATTIHYNASIAADAVTVRRSVNAKAPSNYIYFKNTADQEKVSVSYLEAEQFEENYADFFAAGQTPEKSAVETVWSAAAALAPELRAQLGRDTVPRTSTTYLAKLNEFAAVYGLAALDDSLIKTDDCPVTDGIHYELRSYDQGKTYTVRFWADEGSNGKMADYQVRGNNSTDPDAYEKLPWRLVKVTSCTFEDSITYVGQFVMANMASCTEYSFKRPDVKTHTDAIYFYTNDYVPSSGVTINLSAAANLKGPGGKATADVMSRVRFNYVEAASFIASYDDLWTLDVSDAEGHEAEIRAAQASYSALPEAAQAQLGSDTILGSSETYAAKLSALMAALNLGGKCGDSADYVLSDNGDGTMTLQITGEGALHDYGTDSAPWTARAATITKVTVGDGITALTAGAFSALSNLKSVTVPMTVSTIAEGAFPENPTQKYLMYGYSNHASGRYAEAHSSAVQLKLKSLRILCMGNSHTGDYTKYLNNILSDIDGGVVTDITYTPLTPMGGRMLYYWKTATDDRGSHYNAAHDSTSGTYAQYQAAFSKTWDLIVVQDFHESTVTSNEAYPGGADYASAMQEVVKWLNTVAPGAKIGWFADWAEKASNKGDLDVSYNNSVAAMDAISNLTENKPDFIIPASTVLQNARTSYLGSTYNPHNVLVNNAKGDGTYVFKDCACEEMEKYTVLERDGTHMSLELGRQLMATAFAYTLLQSYDAQIDTVDSFEFFNTLKTAPEYKDGNCYWLGEMTQDIWQIIQESCENALQNRLSVTSSTHTVDPFAAKYDQVKTIVSGVALPDQLSQESLDSAFKSAAVLNELNAIEGINVTAADIKVSYTAPIDGTAEVPAGTDGKLTVYVDCHYGYTYPTEPARAETIKATMEPGAEEALNALKKTAIDKLNGYMSNDSYSGDYCTAVESAKASGVATIQAATSEGEVATALHSAEGAIDKVPTRFELEVVPDANCVARGQIWTGGWNLADGGIEKNYYTLDYAANSQEKKDSTFTGVWWVIRNDGSGGYALEFCKDPGTGYTYAIPDYNANHWLDKWHVKRSYNPLQYNKTPWFVGYGKKISSATVGSGVTVGQFALACFSGIESYTIEDGATLRTNAIYFNPIGADVRVTFKGGATVLKDAFNAHNVQYSYEHYVDVYGDLSKVKTGSGGALEGNLVYAFGDYQIGLYNFDSVTGTYSPCANGLLGAPHYTNGEPDGTDMLRVFNTDTAHTHTLVTIPAVTGCSYDLSEGTYCSDCGAIVTPQQVTAASGEHQWVLTSTVEPAADREGYKLYTCESCGVVKTESIPATAVARITDPETKEVKNYDTVAEAVEAAADKVSENEGQASVTVNLVNDYKLPEGTTATGDATIGEGNKTIEVTGAAASVTVPAAVVLQLANATANVATSSSLKVGDSYSATITPNSGYKLPTSVEGLGSSEYTVNADGTATISVASLKGDLTLAISAELIHEFSSEWASDGDFHWHACTIQGHTDVKDKSRHSGGTATCTEQAVCEDCGRAYGSLADHQLDNTEKVPATSTANGVEAYWTCTVCMKHFADKNATEEIGDLEAWKAGAGMIPATGGGGGSSIPTPKPDPEPTPDPDEPAAPSKGESVVVEGGAVAGATVTVTAVADASGVGGTVAFEAPADTKAASVAVPETVVIGGVTYTVTSIAPHAFKDSASLADVSIPESVIAIGEGAFAGCTSLESVEVAGKLTSIAADAFNGCSKLTGLSTGGVKPMAANAASTGLVIPASVTSIGARAFKGTGITGVTVPPGVKMGTGVFRDCKQLAKASVESGVKTLASYTFKGCSKLKSVSLPSSVTKLERSVFSGCAKLGAVTLGSKVASIGKNAFYKAGAKTLVVKSKKLTKGGVKNALKGSKVATVKVKVSSSKKANKAYAAKYASIFAKANSGKKVKVTY